MELNYYRQEGQNFIVRDEGHAARKKSMLLLLAFTAGGMGVKILKHGFQPATLFFAGIALPVVGAIAYFKSLPIKVSLSATRRMIIHKDKEYSIDLPVQFITKRAYFNFRWAKEYNLYISIKQDNNHTKILLGQGAESMLSALQQETNFILETKFS